MGKSIQYSKKNENDESMIAEYVIEVYKVRLKQKNEKTLIENRNNNNQANLKNIDVNNSNKHAKKIKILVASNANDLDKNEQKGSNETMTMKQVYIAIVIGVDSQVTYQQLPHLNMN